MRARVPAGDVANVSARAVHEEVAHAKAHARWPLGPRAVGGTKPILRRVGGEAAMLPHTVEEGIAVALGQPALEGRTPVALEAPAHGAA